MITQAMYSDFDHAMRGPLTVVLGEAELVLSRADVPEQERRRSIASVIEAIRQMEELLVQWRAVASDGQK